MNTLRTLFVLVCAVTAVSSVNTAFASHTVLRHSTCAVLVDDTLSDWQVEALEQKSYAVVSVNSNQALQPSTWSGLRARFPQGLLTLEFDTYGAVACVPGSTPGSVQSTVNSSAVCDDRYAYVYAQQNRGRMSHYRIDAQYRRFRQDLELVNPRDGVVSTVGRIEDLQEFTGSSRSTMSRAQRIAVRHANMKRNLFKNSFISALPRCSVE